MLTAMQELPAQTASARVVSALLTPDVPQYRDIQDRHPPWGARHSSTAVGMTVLLLGGRMRSAPWRDRAPQNDDTRLHDHAARTPVPLGQVYISLTPKHPGLTQCLPMPVLSAVLGWLWDQKQPWGYIPKLWLRAQPRLGCESPGAVGHAAPPRLRRFGPLSPCFAVSLSPPAAGPGPAGPCRSVPRPAAAVSASLCRQRDTRRSPYRSLALRAPRFVASQHQGSTVP